MTEQDEDSTTGYAAGAAARQAEEKSQQNSDFSESVQNLQTLQEELAASRREAAEHQDRYLRARADMDNFRKRIERTYADRAESSKKDLLKKVLVVKDNLERALQYGNEPGTENSGAGESIIEGIRLTQYQLEQLLQQEGVEEIDAQGKQFDPHFEEAVHRINDPNVPDHAVVKVVRTGYTYGDDVLRPAQVIVSVHQDEESA